MENTDDQLRPRASDVKIETASEVELAEGKMAGKYRIIRLIAEGGMGSVYLAEDVTLGRKVALKAIKFPAQDAKSRHIMLSRFDREARAAGRVSHPNVVTIHAYEQIGKQPLLIMEYVDGHPLREELQGGKALEAGRASRIIIEILKGLEAIHLSNLIHRDIKPANVMVTRTGDRVMILDLGLVKAAESEDVANDDTITQAGVPMGTRFYMSPEQINALPGARTIDGRADIYAVGVMFYHLLTGKPPFDGLTKPIFDQHRFNPLPEMVSPFGELSPALKAIVHKATAKKPDDRYQTAAEMRKALERLLNPPAAKRGGSPTLIAFFCLAAAAAAIFALKTAVPKDDARQPVASATRPIEAAGTPKVPTAAPAPPPAPADAVRITVPPPPAEVVATTKAGCDSYQNGRTSEAVTILTKVVAKSPNDAEALFCLCGAYARKPALAASEREVCARAKEARPQSETRLRQIKLWLRR